MSGHAPVSRRVAAAVLLLFALIAVFQPQVLQVLAPQPVADDLPEEPVVDERAPVRLPSLQPAPENG